MFSVLITLLVAVLVCGLLYYVVSLIPLPPPWQKVAQAIVGLILLLWILNAFGILGTRWRVPL